MAETTNFQFRGQRNYLHSTTIFDSMIGQDPDPTSIDFTFSKMTEHQCIEQPQRLDDPNQTLVASYKSAGLQRWFYESRVPIQERYPCNEALIVDSLAISNGATTFTMPPVAGASYIESIVAAYKKILLETIADLPGKLVFGRVLLDYIPQGGDCSLQHRRTMGANFFESILSHNDIPLGKLYFGTA